MTGFGYNVNGFGVGSSVALISMSYGLLAGGGGGWASL